METGYVENKTVNWELVKALLKESEAENWWSNFGPVNRKLEAYLEERLGNGCVTCSSGTAGLHGLVELHNHLAGKELRWVVPAYTFACAVQGPLRGAQIADCDEQGILDLASLDPMSFDGMVVNDTFGAIPDRQSFIEYAERHGKVLIFDSALAYDRPRDRPVYEMISFHHTKPWGFGEGGCVSLPMEEKEMFRSIINFGLTKNQEAMRDLATNQKMSDVSAAFILSRLHGFEAVKHIYRKRFAKISVLLPYRTIASIATPSCVPIVFDRPIWNLDNTVEVVLRKYYKPLAPLPNATRLYERIVCFPCHPFIDLEPVQIIQCIRDIEQINP